jgi:O-antigen/teichoic acid export membrane protein
MWRLVSGPVVLLLIPLFLTPIQQGYWYLFISLSALSILADLGLTNIILQFSAHEFAFLNFTSDGLLEGEEIHLKRLGSFFRFTIKWISTICLIVFPIIYIVGIYFFSRDQVLETYLLPWTLYAAGSVINFFNNSILSFIEGLNKIETVQKIRLRVAIIYTATIAIILVMGGNIYALAFGLLLSAASIFLSVFGIFKKLLKQILKESKGFIYSWKKEVLPLFTRYAVSGIFGYILFQIYTPLMHYFHGPVYSGKVGITLALVMAVFNMSNIWMYTIIPKMNILISKKLWSELDTIFIKRLLFSIGTYIVITLGIFLFVAFFKNIWVIPRVIDRFLPGIPFIIVFASYFIQIMLNAWGLYLRGHKKEPYVYMFVVCAICAVVSTYLIGLYLSPLWFLTGFFFVCILQLPFGYIIYKKNKILWHKG